MKFYKRPGQGQSLVEFALVLPLLLMLVLSVIEFGILFTELIQLHTVTGNLTTAAARLGGDDQDALKTILLNSASTPFKPDQVEMSVDTLHPDGAIICIDSETSEPCKCDYGDVVRVTTEYHADINILGFHVDDVTLSATNVAVCWRGGRP